ncbi:hypothetical protein DL96DRAFT_1588544 [Flagelloscypha sp. PMI_526]|nr:hypothetical protein DL96DRAFT_1588544 [Flagelloscypha sp. PMI_526]
MLSTDAGSSYIQDSIHTRTQLLQDEMSTGMQLFQDEMRTGMQIFHDELHSHLVDVEDRLATVFTLLEAQNYNARVVGRNAWVVTSDIGSLTPLRKTLRGDGSSRANELITGSQTIGSALINPPPVVGDVPTAWNENLASYNHRDIHHLIVFYNDDFGIVKEDDLAT